MNVNNSPNPNNVADLLRNNNAADVARSSGLQPTTLQPTTLQPTARAAAAGAGTATGTTDDVHLSELVRSLRSLAADSPERQSQIEQLARAAANGTYKPDPHATAEGIINDATNSAAA